MLLEVHNNTNLSLTFSKGHKIGGGKQVGVDLVGIWGGVGRVIKLQCIKLSKN